MPERRRIALTGIGPVTPIGSGIDEFWQSILDGRSGVGPITQFDSSKHSIRIAGEVPGFAIENYLEPKRARRMERFTQMAYAASKLALADAGLEPSDPDPERVGVVIGSGIGGLDIIEKQNQQLQTKGPRYVIPDLVPRLMANAAAGNVGIEFGFQGPNECSVSACASSGHAMARAVDLIRNGLADTVLTGGAESCITPLALAAFGSARALSKRNDDPQGASRPFDKQRDGFVIAEGATVLIFEAWEVARARGAQILAEVMGYGLTADAYHLVMPHPDGTGAASAMSIALKDSQLTTQDIGYIAAHGTSTPLGDLAETKAIRKVFGDDAPPTSSTKSMTGHLLGAAGSTALAATAMGLNHQMLPPTINYHNPDPECDLDVVPNRPRKAKVAYALTNAFGFGGHNVSIVLGKV
ncbi:MAG: beta-ketoacyl-ACP synthase II [Actinomycetota bacterium]